METAGISPVNSGVIDSAPTTSPSSVVKLGAVGTRVDGASRAPLVWERSGKDALSALVARNYNYLPSANRFKDLGAALLERFKTDGSDFSQSLQQAPEDTETTTYDTLLYSQLAPFLTWATIRPASPSRPKAAPRSRSRWTVPRKASACR